MSIELDLEEEVTLEDLNRLASERRDRSSVAIEEVVGGNPARKPTLLEPKSSTPKSRG